MRKIEFTIICIYYQSLLHTKTSGLQKHTNTGFSLFPGKTTKREENRMAKGVKEKGQNERDEVRAKTKFKEYCPKYINANILPPSIG